MRNRFLVFILLILCGCVQSQEKDDIYDKKYPEPELISFSDEDGEAKYLAIPGQCVVLFKDGTTEKKAKEVIKQYGGKIIGKMPSFEYYLVRVREGKESHFVTKLREHNSVDYVFFNTVSSINAYVYIIDDFIKVDEDLLTTHGNVVRQVFSRFAGNKSNIHSVNSRLFYPGIKGFVFSPSSLFIQEMLKIFQGVSSSQLVLVNCSIGVKMSDRKRALYDDEPAEIQSYYVSRQVEDLTLYAKCINKINSKGKSNFVISKSSGNEGMHHMEKIFDRLDSEVYNSLLNNMVLVNAYDQKTDVLYSNNTKRKHPLCTMVDISDLEAAWLGTSYASPKLLGFVDRLSSEYPALNAQDILRAIRQATPDDTSEPMTYEMLEREAAKIAETKKQCKTYSYVVDLTSNSKGNWDLSDGKGYDLVSYTTYDTYGVPYLSGDVPALEIYNKTDYDLEIVLSDVEEKITAQRFYINRGGRLSIIVYRFPFYERISTLKSKVDIYTW